MWGRSARSSKQFSNIRNSGARIRLREIGKVSPKDNLGDVSSAGSSARCSPAVSRLREIQSGTGVGSGGGSQRSSLGESLREMNFRERFILISKRSMRAVYGREETAEKREGRNCSGSSHILTAPTIGHICISSGRQAEEICCRPPIEKSAMW